MLASSPRLGMLLRMHPQCVPLPSDPNKGGYSMSCMREAGRSTDPTRSSQRERGALFFWYDSSVSSSLVRCFDLLEFFPIKHESH